MISQRCLSCYPPSPKSSIWNPWASTWPNLMLGLAENLFRLGRLLPVTQTRGSRKFQLYQHGLLLALLSRVLVTQQQLLASWQLFWEAD